MIWKRHPSVQLPQALDKLATESTWAARWCFLAWVTLIASLALLLVGQLFIARDSVIAALPFALASALLHVVAMSELGSVYWRSRKIQRASSEYADRALHGRTSLGALLAFASQNCAFLVLALAQLTLIAPLLWLPALAMSLVSLASARYAARTSSQIRMFRETSSGAAAIFV